MTNEITTTMRMAKASQDDMDAALDLAGILEDVGNGYFPRRPSRMDGADDDDPTLFDEDDPEHLRAFYDRVRYCLDAAPGGVFRVVYGMATILDPRNEVVDQAVDHLELHPKITAALAKTTKSVAGR